MSESNVNPATDEQVCYYQTTINAVEGAILPELPYGRNTRGRNP
jgi:hypothetical protein